jgi:hypothetical protein
MRKSVKKTIYIFIPLLFSLLILSCNDTSEGETENRNIPSPEKKKENEEKKEKTGKADEYTEEKVDLGLTSQDEKLLMLNEKFPPGTNFRKIHDEFGIKGVRPEGGLDDLAAQGLTESKTKTTFLNKNIEIEFNFKNDTLYSFYYTLTEPNYNEAEKLYKGIKQYYNKKLGPAVTPPVEEDTRDVRTCYWLEKFPYGVLNYNVNTGQISWGFQNTKP